ncbi:MAG: glycoside hydrolase family 130 protein [Lentisphaeria bacterium]|nr:glycoside hydrolase family 130 protein [Lentisphaeria bacterium]
MRPSPRPLCPDIPAIPWQEPEPDGRDAVWRYRDNPLLDWDPIPCASRIFNSAVLAHEGAFVGVFRTEYHDGIPRLHFGRSRDGLAWNIEETPIPFDYEDESLRRFHYAYDPRLVRIEDTFYITWCNDLHGPTIGVARTTDFRTFVQMENAFLPYNRNGVLFPRRIGGRFAMLSRPSDTGHTPFGDIFYSESPDMTFWGRHRHVMSRGGGWWQGLKIGAGPVPIETSEGWLLLYHGVVNTCNGYVYSMGVALLDSDEPWRVRQRCANSLLRPQKPYETTGFVPNVCFPCAALCDGASGRIAIYYGGADTTTCLAFTTVEMLFEAMRRHPQR